MTSRVFAYGMSRSGTTLLTTILDSHPDVSMGYELLTKDVGDPATAAESILKADKVGARACSDALREAGQEQLAVLVHRADRALVSPAELADILKSLSDQDHEDLASLAGRAALATAISELKSRKEGTSVRGFKLNTPSLPEFDALVGDEDANYVYILRDPRDVWSSHVERGFDRSVEQVARTWTRYLNGFETFAKANPGRCHLVRYEDLVSSPSASLDELCKALDLPRDPAMDSFYQSKASVLRGGHANSDALARDFFTTSIGRWKDSVTEQDLMSLETRCFQGMEKYGYPRATNAGFRFGKKEWARYRVRMARKRNYFLKDYAKIVMPAVKKMPHLTWHEAASVDAAGQPGGSVLLIRHDIDGDIENAVKLARWEAEKNIRSTYCVLHSAWYYGRRDEDGRLSGRSENMVERCLEIQSHGHEISLHNNLVVEALRTGANAYDLLTEELAFLRSRGLEITGTSTHGHPLCGQLGFFNFELFSECVYESKGGPRVIEHEGNRVEVGVRSMREFGLTYEGYDLPRDLYITDAGGTLRSVTDTRGRAGKLRNEMDPAPQYDRIVGILTHPEWWEMERPAPRRRTKPTYRKLLKSAGPAD